MARYFNELKFSRVGIFIKMTINIIVSFIIYFQVIFPRDVTFGIRANVLMLLGKLGSELTFVV